MSTAHLESVLRIQTPRLLELLEASYYMLYAVLPMNLVVTGADIGSFVGHFLLTNNCKTNNSMNHFASSQQNPLHIKKKGKHLSLSLLCVHVCVFTGCLSDAPGQIRCQTLSMLVTATTRS